ncbi:Wzz/FepE/Etk N-terminal domain-containing protein [Virgibacillus oceani]|uniref:Polysaccharide chain length determinant N-terminal domain-containing protein n=1 Tax=Virgibacillus oceani TaxID=1479511 RepID=A0A917HAC1_9BACI|nr:Wzz/FepE/Etk N-terminal domain-containing protein [Virgibacillus oceani]GGG73271.1 hypothetical protein GCM10011398_17110 [Virgibacillus oceani]
MEEEISIREIIEKLWKGKWIIVGITFVALVIGLVYSFLFVDPVYKGNAKVAVNNVASVPENVQPYINEMTKPQVFEQTLKSTAVLEKIIEKENLELTVEQLQSKFKLEIPTEKGGNSFISISLEGTDREKIKNIIDNAILLTRAELAKNIQSRLSLLEKEYNLKMEEEDKEIAAAVKKFNEISAGEGLPSLILFQQNTTEGQFVLEINEDILSQLKDLKKIDQIEYEKINSKIQNLTSLYNFYSNKYDEVRSISTMNIVDISTNILSDTFVPNNPVSPNKILNIAIAVILGVIVGVFIVILSDFFRNDTPVINNSEKHNS